MTYAEALKVEVPFGKYKGQPIGNLINSEDEDESSYIDWLLGLDDIKSKRVVDALQAIREHRANPALGESTDTADSDW